MAATPWSRKPRSIVLSVGAIALLAVTSLPFSQAHPVPESWSSGTSLASGNEGTGGSFVGSLYYYLDTSGGLSSYDLATGLWTPLSSGPSLREFTTAAAVAPTGPIFLAIGGGGGGFPGCIPSPGGMCGNLEIYDVTTGTWSAGAPMPTGRAGLGAATLGNLVYVVGGKDCVGTFCSGPFGPPAPGATYNVLEIYDPMTNTWVTGPAMPVPASDVYATAAHGSEIYVFGGWDGVSDIATLQVYDTLSGTWSLGPSMPTARSNAIAGTCGDHIYVIGGLTGAGAFLNDVELFHPLTGTWTTGHPSMPTARGEMAAGDISNGVDTLLAVAGRGGPTTTEVFSVSPCQATPTGQHIGCALGPTFPAPGPNLPPVPVSGYLGVYMGTTPTCGPASPYGIGASFYSNAGSCLGVPANTAIPGAYCGPVTGAGSAHCTVVVPPTTPLGQFGVVVGLDTNFDGWVDTSTGDEAGRMALPTGSWVTGFMGAPPGRIIAFPVSYFTPGSSIVPALIRCT